MKKAALEFFRKSKRILLVPHNCPDPDAMGSALALAFGLEQMGKRVSIALLGSLNEPTKNLLNHVDYELTENPDYKNQDLIVVLDTNSPLLFDINALNKSPAKKVLIDHHSSKTDMLNTFDASYVDENAVSTTQIVYSILKNLGVKPDREICLPIAVGLVVDSAFFIASKPETFKLLYDLLIEGDMKFQEVLDAITTPRTVSERIACIKGAQRMKITRVGEDMIIAVSEVSAYEGNVAKFLIKLGADVSFVGSVHDGEEVRISSRATNRMIDLGLHLGRDILPKVSDLIAGDAGGHAGAAGANGTKPKNLDKALDTCVKETRKFMEGSLKS